MGSVKQIRIATVSLAVMLTGGLWAQTAQSVVGTVTKVDAGAGTLVLKTDAGQEYTVNVAAKVKIRRIAAGETDVSKAALIQLDGIAVNDRAQAKGPVEGQTMTAATLFVMSRGDVTKTQEAQQADWAKRGVTGLVTAVGSDSVTISMRTLAGVKTMTVTPASNAVVRRYAPDSVDFADAKPSTLADIKVGDEVRARGDKSADGAKMEAEEIVSGTFKTIAGVILSINAAASEVTIRDVDTKKPVTVRVNKESNMKMLQPQVAQTIADRLHGASAAGDAGGRGGRGDFAGRGNRGGFNRGGGRSGGDVQQMIDSSPAIILADLKVGDAIVVSSTEGAVAGRVTAIKLLAGVLPILTKPGTQEMSLGGWSLGSGNGGGGDAN